MLVRHAKEATMPSQETVQKLTKFDLLIKSKYDDLGNQEKKIASYLVGNQDIIVSTSVEDIAKATGVSQATVVRFCKRLGFSGMKEFKIFYQAGKLPAGNLKEPATWDDSDETIFNKVFTQAITTLEISFQTTPYQTLANIADCLWKATNIDVFGVGGSAIVASYFHNEFIRLGKRVNAYTDTYMIGQMSQDFQPTDVMIVVSRSGENSPLLKFAEKAMAAGTPIVAITNSAHSSLAHLATHTIITSEVQFFCDDPNSFSRFAQMSMVTTLYLMLAKRLGMETPEFKDNYFERTNYKKFS
jgi:DNA-binding MurR/RpiR family transcriptional regulator